MSGVALGELEGALVWWRGLWNSEAKSAFGYVGRVLGGVVQPEKYGPSRAAGVPELHLIIKVHGKALRDESDWWRHVKPGMFDAELVTLPLGKVHLIESPDVVVG